MFYDEFYNFEKKIFFIHKEIFLSYHHLSDHLLLSLAFDDHSEYILYFQIDRTI